jgi:hypothetical protein
VQGSAEDLSVLTCPVTSDNALTWDDTNFNSCAAACVPGTAVACLHARWLSANVIETASGDDARFWRKWGAGNELLQYQSDMSASAPDIFMAFTGANFAAGLSSAQFARLAS